MYCTKCGKELPENAAFCTKCGNRLSYRSSEISRSDEKRITPEGGNSGKLIFVFAAGCFIAFLAICLIIVMLFLHFTKNKSEMAQNAVEHMGMIETFEKQDETSESSETVEKDAVVESVTEEETTSDEQEKSTNEFMALRDLYAECITDFIRKRDLDVTQIELTETNNDSTPELVMNYYVPNTNNDGYSNTVAVYGIRAGHVIRYFEATIKDYDNCLQIYRGNGETVTWFLRDNGDLYLMRNDGYEKFMLVDSKGSFNITKRYKYGQNDYVASPGADWTSPASHEEVNETIDRIKGSKKEDLDRKTVRCDISRSNSDHEIKAQAIKALEKCQYADRLDDEREIIWPDENIRRQYPGMIYVVYQSLEGLNVHDTPDFKRNSINYDYGPIGAGYHDNEHGDTFYVVKTVQNNAGNKLFLLDNGCYVSANEQMVSYIEF